MKSLDSMIFVHQEVDIGSLTLIKSFNLINNFYFIDKINSNNSLAHIKLITFLLIFERDTRSLISIKNVII